MPVPSSNKAPEIPRQNLLRKYMSANNLLPSVCNTWFIFSSDQCSYKTSGFMQGNLIKLLYKTN